MNSIERQLNAIAEASAAEVRFTDDAVIVERLAARATRQSSITTARWKRPAARKPRATPSRSVRGP